LRERSICCKPAESPVLQPRRGLLHWPPHAPASFWRVFFAVEVRSEEDYGAAGERKLAAKRGDYFAASTVVVWDVDVLQDELIRVYRASAPQNPTVFRRGEIADAEPALPGWTFPVEDMLS